MYALFVSWHDSLFVQQLGLLDASVVMRHTSSSPINLHVTLSMLNISMYGILGVRPSLGTMMYLHWALKFLGLNFTVHTPNYSKSS